MEKPWLLRADAETLTLTLRIVREAQASFLVTGQPKWTRLNDSLKLIIPDAVPSLGSDYETCVELVTGRCILNVYLTDERGGYEIPFTLAGHVPLTDHQGFPGETVKGAFMGWLRGLETAVNETDDAQYQSSKQPHKGLHWF